MESNKDDDGVIDLVDKAMILSSIIGTVPEVWPWLVAFLKKLRLPSPEILYNIAKDRLSQYRNDKDAEHDHAAMSRTFTAKVLDLETQGKMSTWEAQSVCVNNIIAGSDTTAISLNAALYYTYTNPRVLERLRAEIDTMAEAGTISDPVTFQETQKMPYLQAVISEALRVHPAVGVSLPRQVPEGGVHIEGYFFPEGVSSPLRLPSMVFCISVRTFTMAAPHCALIRG